MTGRLSHRLGLLLVAALAVSPGCDGTTDPAAAAPGGRPAGAGTAPATASATAAAPVSEPGHFTGRVTLADGSPIRVPGVEYRITIAGVTAVGENNTFEPPVGPDGSFKLRLPPGLFKPAYGTITVPFEGKKYTLDLDPVDPVKATRESAEGIAQNFVWRLTGPKPGAPNPDVENATHWFGSSVRLIFQAHRADTGQNVKPLPDGSKITWTLKPLSKLLDGSEAKPLTVERKSHERVSAFDALNDLPATNYEVSAVASLPDGSTKRLLLEDMEERRYKPAIKLVLKPSGNSNHYAYLPGMINWVVE